MQKIKDDDTYISQFIFLYQNMIHSSVRSELKINISFNVGCNLLLNMFVWAREHYVVGLGDKSPKEGLRE